MKLARKFHTYFKSENGATAIEYCMIGAALCVCLIAAMPSITGALTTRYGTIGTSITSFK
jgi:Flp pilus assembly pilin Flp